MQTDTDVILRSSDQESFYSWKTLLSISSPIFSAMFSLPQPLTDMTDTTDNVDDGPPVVDLAEDSRTLGHILSLCHPASYTGKQFEVKSVRELGPVLQATMKYDMENVRCTALKELTNPSLLREDPVRIFALACQYECHEAARLAAKYSLALPTLLSEYVPELENIDAGKLCCLLLYREACVTATRSLVDDHTWITYTHSSSLIGCDGGEGWTAVRHPPSRKYPSGRVVDMSAHTWWLEYMTKSGHALQRSPHGDAVKDQRILNDVLSAISSAKCKRCEALQVWETFRSFVDLLSREVERRVAEVEINLGF